MVTTEPLPGGLSPHRGATAAISPPWGRRAVRYGWSESSMQPAPFTVSESQDLERQFFTAKVDFGWTLGRRRLRKYRLLLPSARSSLNRGHSRIASWLPGAALM